MKAKLVSGRMVTSIAGTILMGVVVTVSHALAQMPPTPDFDSQSDLISLHYDHAPDKDDGQSAAADRTLLESLYGAGWLSRRVVAVSGTYGLNRNQFNPASDAVMEAVFSETGGWLSAHNDWDGTVMTLADRWESEIESGGDVWVKEGGQSDLTAAIVRQLRSRAPELSVADRVHVIQHSTWNEEQTTPEALDYVKQTVDYIRIPDANTFLNLAGGNSEFEAAARAHPVFGPIWDAAFAYYDPSERLDFSDTGELLFLLGLGQMPIDDFRRHYLAETDGK